jgi:hypothetical protein
MLTFYKAPKNQPPAAKQAKIAEWFRESMGVYTFKELEKLLPTVGSISGMQVKDYLQALQDENQIRVEKIGSGNWYWSFKSEARKTKENIIHSMKSEESKLMTSLADVEKQIEKEMAKREEEDEKLEGGDMDRKALLEAQETLLKETEVLDRELSIYSKNNLAQVFRKEGEVQKLKDSAIKWTDNIECLEAFVLTLTGDRTQAASMMQVACGDEYVVGEGLKDL